MQLLDPEAEGVEKWPGTMPGAGLPFPESAEAADSRMPGAGCDPQAQSAELAAVPAEEGCGFYPFPLKLLLPWPLSASGDRWQ